MTHQWNIMNLPQTPWLKTVVYSFVLNRNGKLRWKRLTDSTRGLILWDFSYSRLMGLWEATLQSHVKSAVLWPKYKQLCYNAENEMKTNKVFNASWFGSYYCRYFSLSQTGTSEPPTTAAAACSSLCLLTRPGWSKTRLLLLLFYIHYNAGVSFPLDSPVGSELVVHSRYPDHKLYAAPVVFVGVKAASLASDVRRNHPHSQKGNVDESMLHPYFQTWVKCFFLGMKTRKQLNTSFWTAVATVVPTVHERVKSRNNKTQTRAFASLAHLHGHK